MNWRREWQAEVLGIDGRGGQMWKFSDSAQRTAWMVARTEDGPFPVFSAVRGEAPMPGVEQLWDMTRDAVTALFAAVVEGDTAWFMRNAATALMLASTDVLRWDGLEEPIETTRAGAPTFWATPGAPRTPYSWLRVIGDGRPLLIDPYQEDALNGLRFATDATAWVPEAASHGRLRLRRDIPLIRGAISRVDLVFDTQADGLTDPGVFTEILLRSDRESTLLVAADAYFQDEWHHAEDAVVALPDLATADALQWTVGRPSWRPPDLPAN